MMNDGKGTKVDQRVRVRPSAWHCLWGVPFLLVGVGFFAYTLFHGIMHVTDSLTQVIVPGSAELSLQQGLYTVFVEEQSVVNGKIYSTTQSIDGLECHVSCAKDGATIRLVKPRLSTSYTVNGRSGHAVLDFRVLETGKYEFSCDYGQSSRGPEVVVAVGSGVGETIVGTVGGALGAFFGGGGACLVVVLVVLIKRDRAKKRILRSGQAQAQSAQP